jgi:hypothetical protein
MKLGATQRAYTKCVGLLIAQAYKMGYEISLGDAYRDPRLHGMLGTKKGYGHKNSNHKQRLAIDLNLFRDGEFLTATSDHEPLGEWWEALGERVGLPLIWGGRFNDGNHYSCEYRGMK